MQTNIETKYNNFSVSSSAAGFISWKHYNFRETFFLVKLQARVFGTSLFILLNYYLSRYSTRSRVINPFLFQMPLRASATFSRIQDERFFILRQ